MVSIKDISNKCNVSVATVSKALNGHRDISEATRKMVCKMAKEMGYLPNSAARALKTNRTYNLGVLFSDDTQSGLTHEYFSQVLDKFKVQAESSGYDITFINHNIGNKPMSYYEHCQYRGVDGVCIACINFTAPDVIELVNSNLPLVTIDHQFNNRTAILSDNVQGIKDLVQHVIDMGHRKIAFIHGEGTGVTENRLASFYRTCMENGIEIPPAYVKEARYHKPKDTAKATRELLELPQRPTCIMFPDDFSSIGGLNELKEMGLSIPEDISVTGYDGIYLSRVLDPKLTTLRQDTDMLGKQAAIKLIDLIERPRTTLPETVIVKGQLLEGCSVKKLL
ncbi:MAG: LacI family DNA-binding transcriptional regulator [Oscillospiraceae bacterium]|nr:LacI family DNA-binding transcriptional regulator [Oscillospiraceae bacterium]